MSQVIKKTDFKRIKRKFPTGPSTFYITSRKIFTPEQFVETSSDVSHFGSAETMGDETNNERLEGDKDSRDQE